MASPILATAVTFPGPSGPAEPLAVAVRPPPQTILTRVDLHTDCTLLEVSTAPDSARATERLKRVVAAAFQPQAPWAQTEAAIRCYDLYKAYPWATQVLAPFLTYYGGQIVVNAQWFARLHALWTQRAIETVAPTMPALVLQELPQLARLDTAWAKRLVETVVSATPALVFSHTAVLLAYDRQGAQRLLRQAATAAPHSAIAAVPSYIAETWGPTLFAAAVLALPREVINLTTAQRPEHKAVLEALQRSPDARLQALAQMAQSPYERDVKRRLVLFFWEIADHRLTLAEAARISADTPTYFHTLVTMKWQHRYQGNSTVEAILQEEALSLVQYLNYLHDEAEAERFRSVASFSASELYLLIAYGAEEIFTTTYRGVFERLLARMRAEGRTGDQLLEDVQEVYVRSFLKAAATFNRLETFLATFSSPVARWALLMRTVEDIDRAAAVALEAATVADIIDTPLDPHSLRLIRDTIVREYKRAERAHHTSALAVYGLLAARLAHRQESLPADAAFTALAQRYSPYLPTLQVLPAAQLFPQGRNVQRYFFYDDEDGVLSFNSFLAQYRAARLWHLDDGGTFVHLTATAGGRTIDIYANKPASAAEGQQAIDRLLQQGSVRPQVVVHRGHSYHAWQTIEQLSATTVLVFLGSCGGYGRLAAVLDKAPEAHVITTKGIGCHTVNDPLLKALNEYILEGKDVVWSAFWQRATAMLGNHPQFLEYVPPHHHAGMIFLKAYRELTQGHKPPLPLRKGGIHGRPGGAPVYDLHCGAVLGCEVF